MPSDPADPGNDVYYGPLPPRAAAVMEQAIAAIADLGAAVVRANMPTAGWIGGPGTEMAILNRNRESRTWSAWCWPVVFIYELKHDLDRYLRDWATDTDIRSIANIIAFNGARADRALRFGQDLFLAAAATRGDLSEPEYRAARQSDLRSAREQGLDAYMQRHQLDAVMFPGAAGAAIAAKAGYPSVAVPAGFIGGEETPEFPFGVTFTGRAWSEASLLRFAYAFEQATQARRPPPGCRPSAEDLDRTVEGHQPGHDSEFGMAFRDHLAELGQHLFMGLGLGLWRGDVFLAISDLCGTAVAMIDRDEPSMWCS